MGAETDIHRHTENCTTTQHTTQAGPEVFGMHMDGSSEPTVHEGEYELVAWMGHGPTLSAKVHVVA